MFGIGACMDHKQVIEIVKSTRRFVLDKRLVDSVSMKGEADFVTQVDMSISEYVKTELAKLHPDIPLMSEENKVNPSESTRWILDPIDGTTNLVFGYRMSSVSLALLEDGVITFGVVYDPYSGETFTAIRGEGAYLDGKRLSVIDRELKDSLIEFGAGSTRKYDADEAFALGKEVFKNALDLRRICSSALAVSYIAAGRINGYFEKVIKPWDYAAASLILEEAGGRIRNWAGAPIGYDAPTSIVAGSPKVCDALLEIIRSSNGK